MVDTADRMIHYYPIKSVQYGRERWTDEGAKTGIEVWFESIGRYFFDFVWRSSEPAAAKVDSGKSQRIDGGTQGTRQATCAATGGLRGEIQLRRSA